MRKVSPGYQRQTILNLYNSGIPIETISLQLYPSQYVVENIIRELLSADEKKRDWENLKRSIARILLSWRSNWSWKGREEIIRIPHLDILGYTISIATKMTSLSQPDHIIIGELVHNAVGDLHKNHHFRLFQFSPVVWNCVSDNTGGIYRLYTNSPINYVSPI